MAGEVDDADTDALPFDGLEEVVETFHHDVLMPLMAASASTPAAARKVMALIRGKLEQLELLVSLPTGAEPATYGTALVRTPALQAPSDVPADIDFLEIGRNQRAQYRELSLLEIMSTDSRPYSIAQLMRGLEARGLADKQPAVISHLHRMKNADLISQPGSGMYMVTPDGLGQLQRLRKSVGALRRG